MKIDRRGLFGALGAATAAGLAVGANAQTQAAPAADRISEAARASRLRLEFDGVAFSGPAWDLLTAEGRAAHLFLIGEEHGIAENPKLGAALFRALAPEGYSKLFVETSPPMARELDQAVTEGGMEGVRRLYADPGARAAFFGMREEAEMLAGVRQAIGGRAPFLCGLDYEVAGDRRLIALLKQKRKPDAAAAALAALESAALAAWAQYDQTRSPQHIFSFSGDPALVAAVRDAWPRADAEAAWILDTLEQTLVINRHWAQGRGHQSNVARAAFNRSNLLRHLRQQETLEKAIFKFGAYHMMRGLTGTFCFDIGTLAFELAALNGKTAFNMMVLPGPSAPHAQLDPTSFTYRPTVEDRTYLAGLAPFFEAAFADAFTLFDLRPLRPLATVGGASEPDGQPYIHGFDALLVMSGCTASANL